MKQLVKTIGDRDNPFHRESLAGNAMFFNNTRTVELSNGTHNIPFLASDLSFTIFVSARVVSIVDEITWGASFVIQRQSNPNVVSSPALVWVDGTGTFFGTRPFTSISWWRYSTLVNHYNRRNMYAYVNAGGSINTNTLFNYHNSRFLIANYSSANNLPSNLVPTSNIFIGGYPQFNHNSKFTNAHIRSVEILLRNLNSEELRAAFNYGTIYHAWQAGKISISNPIDLISIDFNRLNGQPPICRTGTRQLTVQVYNNATPDNTVATYADWYSL